MDILDRLLGHDAWTTEAVLRCCGALSDVELDRPLGVGLGTVRATATHIVKNMEYWTDQIAERPVRPHPPAPHTQSVPHLLSRLAAASRDLSETSRALLRAGRLDDTFTDSPDPDGARFSFGGAIVHVITHSMHHRAQLLLMLRRLGVPELPEGDVLSWEEQLQRAAGATREE